MASLGLRGCSKHPLGTRWRRRLICLSAFFALLVFPAAVGAAAGPPEESAAAGTSRIDGISWMNIRDSSGTPLANYVFVSEQGSLFNPGGMTIWAILGLEFVGYMIIVTAAIWFAGYALSFQWLDLFASALRGVGKAFANEVATPIVLVTAATVGACCVAWFVVRGFHAKAALQVLIMLAVAVVGPLFLADPLADVLSSDGVLGQGRDLGLSVAAGLGGDHSQGSAQLLASTQGDMADSFARRPIQVWNFGHVVDDRETCAAAWSAGVGSGDEEQVRDGLEACGDTAAAAAADNPTFGQICTGLLLLLCSTVLVAFCAVLGGKIIKAGLNTIYQAFMAIFGFAAGGFMYGPTQTFLVRNLVEMVIAGCRMCVYTVFLSIYLLFLRNLFHEARGQVIAVIVIAAVIHVVAILQMQRLSNGLTGGSRWIANRAASTIQNAGTTVRGSGSAPGPALGMGTQSSDNSTGFGGVVAGLAALTAVSRSPITAWLAGGTVKPLDPLALAHKKTTLADAETAPARAESYAWSHSSRQHWRMTAIRHSAPDGGMQTELGMARALKTLTDNGVPENDLIPALVSAGGTAELAGNAMYARAKRDNALPSWRSGAQSARMAMSSANAVPNHLDVPESRAVAARAVVDADEFVHNSHAPRAGAVLDQNFIAKVEQNWDTTTPLHDLIPPEEWAAVDRDTRWSIGHRVAVQHQEAARAYEQAASQENLDRLATTTRRIANLTFPEGFTPWDT